MCDLGSGSDFNADVSDVSVDISDSVDTNVGSESFDMDINDVSEDIGVDFSDIDFEEESLEVDDISEDISEEGYDEIIDNSSDEIYEMEEDIGEEITDGVEELPEVIEENGYEYTLDSDGRVSEVEGDLRLETGERDLIAQREAGGEFRRDTDDGGHFIGNRFDGPGGDINMFAQDSNLNRGGYKSMENEWARELGKGNDVHVKIDPIYQDGTERPHAIMGEYTVTEDGNATKEYFSFTNENLRSDEFNIDEDDFEFPEEKD